MNIIDLLGANKKVAELKQAMKSMEGNPIEGQEFEAQDTIGNNTISVKVNASGYISNITYQGIPKMTFSQQNMFFLIDIVNDAIQKQQQAYQTAIQAQEAQIAKMIYG
jgi:hypothetical protein